MVKTFSIQTLVLACCLTLIYSQQEATDPKEVQQCVQHESVDWDRESETHCPNDPSWYHCLQDESGINKFYQFCRHYIYVQAGTYPTYSPLRNEIHPRDCPEGTFQYGRKKSSEINKCTDKVKCDEYGQLICTEGSRTKDRLCKCDYKRGLAVSAYGDNPSAARECCPDTDPSCQCFPKNCDPNEELNEIYQCMAKCQKGYFRPSKDDECRPVSSLTSAAVTVTQTTTPRKISTTLSESVTKTTVDGSTSIPTSPLSNGKRTIGIVVGSLAAVCFTVFLIIIICFCRCRERYDTFTDWLCCVSRERIRLRRSEAATYTKSNPVIGCTCCTRLTHDDKEIDIKLDDINPPPRRRKSSFAEYILETRCCGLCRKIKLSRKKTASGEELRKDIDTTIDYNWMQKITDGKINQRVGRITCGTIHGTGFRVGDMYIASAYHIFEDKLESIWIALLCKVVEFNPELDECATKFGVSSNRTGKTTYNEVDCLYREWKTRFNHDVTFKDLIDMGIFDGKISNTDLQNLIMRDWDAHIIFNYVNEKSEILKFKLDHNIEFYNKVNDIIVLKLVQEDDKSIPPPFVLEVGSVVSPMHLFGHPDGKYLQVDPKCEVYTQENEVKLQNDTKFAIEYCEKHHRDWCRESKCNRNDLKDLRNEYQNLSKSFDGSVIFHCSESIVHGASGSPGVITQPDMDLDNPNAFKVQAMLQSGHPDTLYAKLNRDDRKKLQQKVLFEKGILMRTFHECLDDFPELRRNLFSTPSKTEPKISPGQSDNLNDGINLKPPNEKNEQRNLFGKNGDVQSESNSQPTIVKHKTTYNIGTLNVIQDSENITTGEKGKLIVKTSAIPEEAPVIEADGENDDELTRLLEETVKAEKQKPNEGKKSRYKDEKKYSLVRQDAESKDSEDETSKKPFELLKQNIKLLGLKLRLPPTPEDGNCFFHAISNQLERLGLPFRDHKTLREDIVDFLRSLSQTEVDHKCVKDFVEGAGNNKEQRWEDYLKDMSRDGTYADEVIVKHMAEMLKQTITVVTSSPDGSKTDQLQKIYNQDSQSDNESLLVGHIHENHYVSLEPEPEHEPETE